MTDTDLANDPDYGPQHPLRRREQEREDLVRNSMDEQRQDQTWIASEYWMGKINS